MRARFKTTTRFILAALFSFLFFKILLKTLTNLHTVLSWSCCYMKITNLYIITFRVLLPNNTDFSGFISNITDTFLDLISSKNDTFRVTAKQYWHFFQNSHQAILTLSQTYCHTILTFSEFISNNTENFWVVVKQYWLFSVYIKQHWQFERITPK